MNISKEDAQKLVYGGSIEGLVVVGNEVVGHSGWSVKKRVFFHNLIDGITYGLDYETGATEYQEQEPFEYSEPKPYEVEIVMVPTYKRKNITLASQSTPQTPKYPPQLVEAALRSRSSNG